MLFGSFRGLSQLCIIATSNPERASYNGSIEASQASDVGSIPIARSRFKSSYPAASFSMFLVQVVDVFTAYLRMIDESIQKAEGHRS
jgi:hypothetical protein